MTASSITNAAVEAAADVLDAECGESLTAHITTARALLEAAAPLLAPQPVVDREALVQLVAYCREREVYKGRDNEIGADTAYGDVADRLDDILALVNGTAK